MVPRVGAEVHGGNLTTWQQYAWMDWNRSPHSAWGANVGAMGGQPYVKVSTPLGVHLHLATKEDIWKGGICGHILASLQGT